MFNLIRLSKGLLIYGYEGIDTMKDMGPAHGYRLENLAINN